MAKNAERPVIRESRPFVFRGHKMSPWVRHLGVAGAEIMATAYCIRCLDVLVDRPAGHILGGGRFGGCLERCRCV